MYLYILKIPGLNTTKYLHSSDWSQIYKVWQYGLWSFQAGGTKLERFLHKNQHT